MRAVAPRTGGVAGPAATAWLEAVEAALPPVTRTTSRRRLASVRTRGVTLMPGSVRAEVRQEGMHNQLCELRIPEPDDATLEHLLELSARHGRWLAALALGELPDDLAEVLLPEGLAPRPASLTAQCSCRSVPGMCVHAGIAGNVVARMLTQAPEQLLVIRGMGPDRIRDRIVRRLPGGKDSGGLLDPSTIAWDELVMAPAVRLPVAPAPGDVEEPPGPFPTPPHGHGIEPGDLEELAADAAARARELLHDGGDGGLGLDTDSDLARRAARAAGGTDALAARLGMDPAELDALADAWLLGGPGAVGALRRPWYATPRALEEGVAAMRERTRGRPVARMNRVLSEDERIELALGRDGLWYRIHRASMFAPEALVGPGTADVRELLAEPSGDPAEQLRLL